MKYDVAVLGGGPGGYVAAIRSAQLGATVCLIEDKHVGGTCLNRGCIPTKAIISSAELYQKMKHASDFGITTENTSFDIEKIIDRKNNIVINMRQGIERLLKNKKVEIIKGWGKLVSKNEINITSESEIKIEASKIILATGSETLVPPVFNIKSDKVITSDEALELKKVPESIIIAGGGYVGCEWATIFNSLDCNVTIIEMLKNIVPTEDIQISRFLQTSLKKNGITILTNSRISEIKDNGSQIEALLENGKTITADKMLLSLGRKLNTRNIGLEEIGLAFDGEKISVDEHLKTSIANIFAIGDITGKKLLAHVASAQGIIAAENAIGMNKKIIDYSLIPSCIYTYPEAASVGFTEEQIKKQGINYIKGRYPFTVNGKAHCIGDANGFIIIFAEKEDHKVLGIHIIGPKATEMISMGAFIVTNGLTAKEAIRTIMPHPTLSESLMEALALIEKECIHFGN